MQREAGYVSRHCPQLLSWRLEVIVALQVGMRQKMNMMAAV
jgi:hypothetical protein